MPAVHVIHMTMTMQLRTSVFIICMRSSFFFHSQQYTREYKYCLLLATPYNEKLILINRSRPFNNKLSTLRWHSSTINWLSQRFYYKIKLFLCCCLYISVECRLDSLNALIIFVFWFAIVSTQYSSADKKKCLNIVFHHHHLLDNAK